MKLITGDKRWYCVRTFSGDERDVAEELHKAGFDAYREASAIAAGLSVRGPT
jgi:hypothetical protein